MLRHKLKFLFIQPEFHRHYVTFFPVYEPMHGLLFAAIAEDMADSIIFDRRFDTDKNLERLLRDFQPDIVGSTTHTAGEIFNVKRLLALTKKVCPKAVTIVGGQHATLLPEDFFGSEVDIICIGPGEETFREVMETLAIGGDFTNIAGLAVRQGEDYIITPPRIPSTMYIKWPRFNRKLIAQKYIRNYLMTFEFKPTVYTITTSGCPFRCKFCSLWAAARGMYRSRLPEDVVEDIASQPQTYVHLTDDNTFMYKDHAMEIYRLLKKRGIKKKILAYARVDTILKNTYLFEKWREVGLGALVVGMEGVSDRHLIAVNKKTDIQMNIKAQKIMDSLNIENWAHFVLLPNFTKEDFDAVWNFVDELNITYPVFIPYTPVPGTPLFFEAKEKNELAVFDYGFYNLEYMVMKTTIPKKDWYKYMLDLYKKTCSPRTLYKRRKSPSFHVRPAVGRALAMRPVVWRLQPHIKEQLELEKKENYYEIEHTLPPSLKSDYKPNKYYNSTTLEKTVKTHGD